ncbi:RNA polymerase sigma factor [Chitinophaga vietnamensis]|uniref:RNA polymerase sigma factor n=1 Tax=Chitinophaga vietnamensis TaxID=2593957 RepID=UPI0011783325|nr:sigma-70 family RNA polymerase sigma factor [Chitinophaga vietnamensis]
MNAIPNQQLLIKRFENIYAATYDKLYLFAKRYVKENDAIKDILQDSYIRLWEHLENLQDDEKILPLLRTIVMRVTIDVLRKAASDQQRSAVFYEQRRTTCEADEILDMKEAIAGYEESVRLLPDKRRQVYQLIQEEGLSYKEAAQRLNISLHTIKYHFTKARQTLQKKLPGIGFIFLLSSALMLFCQIKDVKKELSRHRKEVDVIQKERG